MGRTTKPVLERVMAKVIKSDTCWLWQGATTGNGYGVVRVAGKNVLVHRVVWEELVGPIPEGYQIDHVASRGCTNRNCVKLEHLEPVTQDENLKRAGIRNKSGKCRRGHTMTPANTYTKPDGRTECRTCRHDYNYSYYTKGDDISVSNSI